MIETFNVLNEIEQTEAVPISSKNFSMPLGLRTIKECARFGVEWRGIHIVDLFSLIYSYRIDTFNERIKEKRKAELSKRGIRSVKRASETDFDSL